MDKPRPALEKPRLALVVDDDPATRRLLRLALAPYGFDVEEAGNGLEAMDALQDTAPDVVIVDLAMPVMDGWSFLREANPHVPTFVLSVTNARRAAMQLGATGWMGKPFDPDVLGEAIASLVDAHGNAV